jgi:hypothetical protein
MLKAELKPTRPLSDGSLFPFGNNRKEGKRMADVELSWYRWFLKQPWAVGRGMAGGAGLRARDFCAGAGAGGAIRATAQAGGGDGPGRAEARSGQGGGRLRGVQAAEGVAEMSDNNESILFLAKTLTRKMSVSPSTIIAALAPHMNPCWMSSTDAINKVIEVTLNEGPAPECDHRFQWGWNCTTQLKCAACKKEWPL